MKERDAVRALKNLGFSPADQTGTSHKHWKMIRGGTMYKVTLAPHNGEVQANDICSMIRQAGVSKKQWFQAACDLEIEGTAALTPDPQDSTKD